MCSQRTCSRCIAYVLLLNELLYISRKESACKMYLELKFPETAGDYVEVALDEHEPFTALARLIATNAPRDLKDTLFTQFTPVVARDEGETVVPLESPQPISILLKPDDIVEFKPGAPPRAEAGRPVQIMSLVGDDFELHQEELTRILTSYECRDLPVVVISIAGKFRTGKSFLLNFVINELSASQQGFNSKDDEGHSRGFSWESGTTRHTSGIWMWNRPFYRLLPDGTKVAILVMDTQGTFDNETTMSQNTKLFAFNALIASHNIFNVKEVLAEDVLQNLNLFATYGKRVAAGLDGKPFQRLQVLVRDAFDDFPFGDKGGSQYVAKVLSGGAAQELQDTRSSIKDCFTEVEGFLMPHPGIKATRSKFSGDGAELDEEFVQWLPVLLNTVVAADRLLIKTVGGVNVTCACLLDHMKAFSAALSSDDLPEVTTLLSSLEHLQLSDVRSAALRVYTDCMETVVSNARGYVRQARVEEIHTEAYGAAMTFIESSRLLCGDAEKQRLVEEVQQELRDKKKYYIDMNNHKDLFRGLRTPFAFVVLIVLSNIIGAASSLLFLQIVADILNVVSTMSFVITIGWAVATYMGTAHRLTNELDKWAQLIWWSLNQGVVGTLGNNHPVAAFIGGQVSATESSDANDHAHQD
eukprot:m.354666 g.354666  ORF g.354666 m.354666 type:complete len:641 (-) comp17076_c0_seq1:246-2168(-)